MSDLKILVVGSGGREHAICSVLANSDRESVRIVCAEGNAGIAQIAETVPVKADDIDGLLDLAKRSHVDLTFVGGETSLVAGIVDCFAEAGLRIIGPTSAAARLEGSKIFSKNFMKRNGIPTAGFETADSVQQAKEILAETFSDRGSVIKADGLAAGKGVVVCGNLDEALKAVDSLEAIAGRSACSQILIEERLNGREVSLLLFSDGKDYRLMPPVRDHKRLLDGDQGPNTGGMGTVCSDDLIDDSMRAILEDRVVRPTLEGAAREGFPFKGVLFIGLMMTADGPMVLEYNVRFGDPETQSLMMRLQTPLIDILRAIDAETLGDLDVVWKRGTSATVVLAAHGYPNSPRKGDSIRGLDSVEQTDALRIFHAGTAVDANGSISTSGGRVLAVSAFAENLSSALGRAYDAVQKIDFDGKQFRRDIGV